jgi:thymidylate synthase (FAD)
MEAGLSKSVNLDHLMFGVLDHGYVRHVESWGRGDADEPEAAIIEAARQSTQGSFRGWDLDEKLLRFMYTHKHSTPFEFAGMTIEVQAPILVFREWHRHRTQGYNEMSARYAPLPDVNYVPTLERLFLTSTQNKQAMTAAGAEELTKLTAQAWLAAVEDLYADAEALYQVGLKVGIPKELARIILPVGRYSRMRATANLRNWLAFLTLRMDPAAQWEIRQFANAVGVIIADQFPRTWALFQGANVG